MSTWLWWIISSVRHINTFLSSGIRSSGPTQRWAWDPQGRCAWREDAFIRSHVVDMSAPQALSRATIEEGWAESHFVKTTDPPLGASVASLVIGDNCLYFVSIGMGEEIRARSLDPRITTWKRQGQMVVEHHLGRQMRAGFRFFAFPSNSLIKLFMLVNLM